jgi:nucleoside-diphosphate-sugar epimerase
VTREAKSFPRVVVTGASGWIGSALQAHLAARLGGAWREHVTLFGSTARHIDAPGGTMEVRPLADLGGDDVGDAMVVHLAYLTKEKVQSGDDAAFAAANAAIDDHVLDAIGKAAPRSVFVASSGAAMLAEKGDRHPYGVSKLAQEERFLAAANAAGVPLLVGRVFNLAGPHINKIDSYAIGAFAAQALARGVIRVDASVPVFRSFLHVDDLCALIVDAGVARLSWPRPMDLCGAETLEMGEIATRVAAAVGADISIERDAVDLSKPSLYLGKAADTKLVAMALGRDLRSFDQQVADTVQYIAALQDEHGGFAARPSAAHGRLVRSGRSPVLAAASSLPEADHNIAPSVGTDGGLAIGVRRK